MFLFRRILHTCNKLSFVFFLFTNHVLTSGSEATSERGRGDRTWKRMRIKSWKKEEKNEERKRRENQNIKSKVTKRKKPVVLL